MNMKKKRSLLRTFVAIVLSMVMMLGFAMPVFAADYEMPDIGREDQYESPNDPVGIDYDTETVGTVEALNVAIVPAQLMPLTMSAVAPPAGMSRATGWDHVEGAGSFRVYAFNNRDAAVNATAATAHSLAVAWSTIPATGERIATDARMIVFEGPATRELPVGFKPAGLGASAPAAGSVNGAYETNLVPDQYWFRVMAIPANPGVNSPSELSVVHTATQSFNIAMGPDEARAYIEGRLDDIGTTLRLIDIRFGATESGNEGFLRFFEPPGLTSTINNQTNANNLLLQGGLTPEEVTVMLF